MKAMLARGAGLRGRFRELAAAAACVGACTAGCAGGDAPAPIAQERVVVAPAEPEIPMGPLSIAWDAQPSPETLMTRADGVSVDARLLVITANGTSAALAAITTVLGYLGTPYDVLDASTGPNVTPDYLAAGDHGRYHGILLDSGDLAVGSSSAFSDAEWMALAAYEARFGVRRAVVYAHPSAAYGLTLTGGSDARATPIAAHCTTAGAAVFVGANCAGPVTIDDGWAYASQASDAFTTPLLVDAAGAVYAATRSYADGREVLLLTFAQSPTAFHTLALGYGVVNWVTHGVFVGEHHVYASPQIDDFYLASKIYTGDKYRITAADLQAFADWQNARRRDPLTAHFRSAFAFNAYGAKPGGQDALTDKGHELQGSFTWINHTWDHQDMNAMSYATAFEELNKNNQYGIGAGFDEYTVENLVTPGISGLDNAEVMRAAFDVGIRQLVSDTSVAGQANPSPNAGYYNALNPGLLMMPRRPVDLYFDVSQPSEWTVEYGVRHTGTFTYEQLIAIVSDSLARYMLRGENDAWMFHQANLRDNGGGKSLLSDLLDAAFAKYAARATFPVVSPAMDDLAERVEARMDLDASGVSATIGPGSQLSVRVMNAARVPVTGLCTPSAETYAGQQISYLHLKAGQSVTLSLADCNPGTTDGGGPTGTGGGGGSGTGGGGGSATIGTLGNSDGSIGPVVPDAACGCVASGVAGQRGAWALLFAIAAVAWARRRSAR
jgi:hypothetical protein